MTTHKAVVVGAGFGGLTMAAELKHAGIGEFLVLEFTDRGWGWTRCSSCVTS